ncbi:site-specific integrase [Xanthobacter flavus]|uniref:tyrosine-type recombinase/integrase n=1 Tax=Xanthobacter flavus TaxID=281 RepID=UPI0037276569
MLYDTDDFPGRGSSVVPVRYIGHWMGTKITKRAVDALKPTAQEYFTWDSDLPGFGVRVRPSGAMSYVVKYRAGKGRSAPTRRVTISAVGKITPEEAREQAKRVVADAMRGNDPARERARERGAPTLSALADRFLAEHVDVKRKASTSVGYRGIVDRDLKPALGSRKAETIIRADIARLHSEMANRPIQANRMLAIVGKLYAWSASRGLTPEGVNPARGIEKYRESGRERFLTAEELGRLGAALEEAETVGLPYEVDEGGPRAKHAPKAENRRVKLGPHPVAALRLLLFTGARLREILHLRWEEIDFERGLAFLPDSKTGRKPLVLSSAALRVLVDLPRVGQFVIAGDSEDQPRRDLNRPWIAVRRRAKLDGVRLHDLRHSFASVGAGAGLGLTIVGKLLGHAQPSTTARYSHLDADPLRRAADSIGDKISAAMSGAKAADVVRIRANNGQPRKIVS